MSSAVEAGSARHEEELVCVSALLGADVRRLETEVDQLRKDLAEETRLRRGWEETAAAAAAERDALSSSRECAIAEATAASTHSNESTRREEKTRRVLHLEVRRQLSALQAIASGLAPMQPERGWMRSGLERGARSSEFECVMRSR